MRRLEPGVVWAAMLLGVTAALYSMRAGTDQVHVVQCYLLVVLGGSVSGGRGLGLSLAFGAFVLIDVFFQLPYDEITVGKPLDWVVLLSFLVTAFVATELLARARREALEARRRADEVARLSAEHERLIQEAEHANALREADRLKDMVLASVSHDLRTPLTTIKALAQDSAAHGDENAPAIEEQADRLGRLVADLLDLSRLKGGALPVTPEVNTAEDLIGAAIRQVTGLLNGRSVVPHVDTSRPALVGNFDFVQSLRILGNLLENALRYAPPGSAVDLAAGARGDKLVFEVSDRGPGVPEAERERIFEVFYRGSGGEPDGGRAGLGLSIARRLAELQGGSLLYAPRPGGGSTFTLELPALDLLMES